MRKACTITLSPKIHTQLKKWSHGRSTPVRLVLRSKIVLLATRGMENKDIATSLGTTNRNVGVWRNRFAENGIRGIVKDAPRSGRKPTARNAVV